MKIFYDSSILTKNTLLYIMLFPIILLSVSCNSYEKDKNISSNNNKSFTEIALNKYKNNVNYQYSPDSNYVVCFRKETQKEANGVPQFRFFIYDLKNNKITFEDNSRTESFSWINNYKLKVMKRPGIISVDPKKNINMMGYIYDLSQNKKLPLRNNLNDN